ncbi:phospho ECPP44-like [Olea europaea subsp. europaea]|uniref:Phospho ECPP44-like n=1 Tax=Olea europaea subsp. europaea TaxID=158383 RepID=A0A8S0PKM5_OLEEU|nr:phospho ECPP44-like [Olea europaea subsp. europaea]
MADEVQYHHHQNIEKKSDEPCDHGVDHPVKFEEYSAAPPVEGTDRGLFDFMGKKDEEKKCEEEVIAPHFEEKVQVSEPECKKEEKEEEKKHESLREKLQRSSSSSSDEEEVEGGGEKKKKKNKGLKEKIKEKVSGDDKEEEKIEKYEFEPVEKCDEIPVHEESEKKGFLEKIKEKLPGGEKKEVDVEVHPPPYPAAVECATPEGEAKEKKGFLDKIKEKLPGHHSKTEEEKDKEKEKESAYH